MTIWRDIEGFESYAVSDQGDIMNKNTGEFVKKHDHPKGYDQVYFANHTFLVHKIVCAAFHDNPDNKPCVDHIDGNKKNNAASNLRWSTYHENNSNPVTSIKNRREPWNKGIKIVSPEYLAKIREAGKKGAIATHQKAIERKNNKEAS